MCPRLKRYYNYCLALCISTMITLCGEVKALGIFCMVYALNVLPLNTPLTCSLSGRFGLDGLLVEENG